MSHSSSRNLVIPVDIPDFFTPLYRDFLAGAGPAAGRTPSSFRDPGSWKSIAEDALSHSKATEELWRETESFNRRLGASENAMRGIRELSQRTSVAVVAGQQPGLLGGPLLVLYKAATAVSLSNYVTEVTGIPCAPLFVVASDDSDLAEVATCTLHDGSLRRLTVQFSAEGYAAGRMVGGLPVEEEIRLARSMIEALGGAPGLEDVAALLERVGARARDHGEFVAGLLCSILSQEGLVLVDGRSPAMRKAGAALFRSYVSRGSELKKAVEAASSEMEKMGYHAQITGASLDSWLFILENGIRRKITAGAKDALELAVRESPELLSPNVALRPIWRESTLPTVCCICGPSEVAYTLQLREAYKILGVRMPVIFPRLSATLVPSEAVEQAGEWSKPALEGLLGDFEGARDLHYRGLIPRPAMDALEHARISLDESLGRLAGALQDYSDQWGVAADSVRRAAAKGLERLKRDIVDGMRRDDQKENPRLKGLGEFLLPDGRLQERTLAFVFPLLEEGLSFVSAVVALARSHVEESASGRVRHYCRKLKDESRRV